MPKRVPLKNDKTRPRSRKCDCGPVKISITAEVVVVLSELDGVFAQKEEQRRALEAVLAENVFLLYS